MTGIILLVPGCFFWFAPAFNGGMAVLALLTYGAVTRQRFKYDFNADGVIFAFDRYSPPACWRQSCAVTRRSRREQANDFSTLHQVKAAMMKNVLHSFVWLLLFVAGFSHAESLTEEQVHTVLAEADRAINALDAEGVGNIMVPDARIIMHLKAGGYRETITVNRNRYVEMLKEAWANYSHYAYVRDSVEIVIDESGEQALVKATVFETMVVKGETTEGISREEMVFRRVDGRLLITGVESWTSL